MDPTTLDLLGLQVHQLRSALSLAVARTEHAMRVCRHSEECSRQIKGVHAVCARAHNELDNIVDVMRSRMGPEESHIEAVQGGELVEIARGILDVSDVLHGRPLRSAFVADEGVASLMVSADRRLFARALWNVVDNALRYGYESEPIETHVRLKGGLQILVRSHGIPLEGQDLARCKELGWRGARTRFVAPSGAGIGLWVATSVMGAQGGALEVSAHGDLTTVLLELPLWQDL